MNTPSTFLERRADQMAAEKLKHVLATTPPQLVIACKNAISHSFKQKNLLVLESANLVQTTAVDRDQVALVADGDLTTPVLLCNVHRQQADEAKRSDDIAKFQRAKLIEHTRSWLGSVSTWPSLCDDTRSPITATPPKQDHPCQN